MREQARAPLPRGLRDGQQVTLLAFLPGQRLVEADGRRFTVAMSNLRTELLWEERAEAGWEGEEAVVLTTELGAAALA